MSTDVDEVTFNRGYYTVNLRFFYRIRGEAHTPINQSMPIVGISVFDKRVMLFGSEGNAKVFSSAASVSGLDARDIVNSDKPTAVVEAVDPIILDLKFTESPLPLDAFDIPEFISDALDSQIVFEGCNRTLTATLGQFSIVRLERDSQLLMPIYDYCVPEKECIASDDDDPCSLFSRIDFPISEFFPPDSLRPPEGYHEVINAMGR